VSLFHSDRGIEGERITHFHAGHGSGCAVLAWDVRGDEPCEVLVLRSLQGFAEAPGDRDGAAGQTLVYQGSERRASVIDEDLESDMAYYYTVFSRSEDGVWRFELETTVTPLGDAHWRRAGVENEGESAAKWAKLNFDINTLSRDGFGVV